MVDMGTTNENIDIICKGKKVTRLASQALQFVFHGFTGFRWPVSYYGSTTATSHQLYLTFWKSVDVLEEMGFTVDYMMADGATTNRSFTSMLFNGNPREELFLFKNVYNREHVIVAIQDIKHVLKRIRNNIESSRRENQGNSNGRYLVLEGQAILWDHWEECFFFNYQGGFEIHNKLTEDHITLTAASKMRNQLAIDVLNKNMLFLMKSYQQTLPDPERLSSSIRLLEATSIICDIFCSINHPVTSMEDPRIAEIFQALQFFNRWEADTLDSSPTLAKKNLMTKETRDDINSSLVGFTSLCRQTIGKGNTLNPGFLNSDLIENFFCQQRGIRNGLNSNPTLAQFGKSSTAVILGQCIVSRRANASESASASNFRAKLSRPLNSTRKSKKQIKMRKLRI
ncbi:uncharacterized protein LOC133181293 [Saccostrea echinata]|uniref:uncharacterized protein LOC133181293 n=1 Tax=Saccostrea echinata TaxID=191078 RepID=UPI002A82BDC7|nr:uncharacterized protein LOC133181293 [Saccostrea echinata]